jgi:hypothetical protein
MKLIRYTQILRLVLFVFVIITIPKTYGQVTTIPDPNFEQALIDQGIDSDGIINGQVLTSDIDEVINLNVLNKFIQDLTGIEDFNSLQNLIINGRSIEILNLSSNIQLIDLRIQLLGINDESMNLTQLDLSGNINLEFFYGQNMLSLETLNVKNGNNENLIVSMPCVFEAKNCELGGLECVEVDNATAATNNETPYSNWGIEGNNFVFSEDCSTLGVAEQDVVSITLYPNPIQDQLFIKTKNSLQTATIFSVTGQVVSIYDMANATTINTSKLSQGLYFITIEDIEGNNVTKRFVKK